MAFAVEVLAVATVVVGVEVGVRVRVEQRMAGMAFAAELSAAVVVR